MLNVNLYLVASDCEEDSSSGNHIPELLLKFVKEL